MKSQAVINYCLNRICPAAFLLVLIFLNLDLTSWEPYVMIGLITFIDRFQFKVGYAVGYCEAQGIDPMNPDAKVLKKINERKD